MKCIPFIRHIAVGLLLGGAAGAITGTIITIQPGAFAIGKEIRDIFWPAGLFVLSVDHRRALGGHTLHEGDELYIRYVTYTESRLWEELTAIVGEQPKEN